MNIIYAGYGVWTDCKECTAEIQVAYSGGTRKFFANNDWVGDPHPNERKYLFIIWERNGARFSGVVGESDSTGIVLP